MKKYNVVYPFDVIEKIKVGDKVYMLDREKAKVHIASNVAAGFLCKAINDKTGRFDFWTVDEAKDEEVTVAAIDSRFCDNLDN
jgi:hypothetical protein